jgi:hypothetical protein
VFVVRRIDAAQADFIERALVPPPRPDAVSAWPPTSV